VSLKNKRLVLFGMQKFTFEKRKKRLALDFISVDKFTRTYTSTATKLQKGISSNNVTEKN
jgi:hypothetical protein